MVQRLSEYVHQLQRGGYSSQIIRSHLLRAGYSSKELAEALGSSAEQTTKKFLNAKIAGFVLGIMLIAFLIVYFTFFYTALEVSLQLSPPKELSFNSGSIVSFEKTISSSHKKVNVDVKYEIVSVAGAPLTQKTEKLLISGESKSISRMNLPTNLPAGDYTLKVSVFFDSKSNSANFSFRAISPQNSKNETLDAEKPAPGTNEGVIVSCPDNCVDINPCINGVCVRGACQFTQITPCCGNSKCEPSEDELTCASDCTLQIESREGVFASASAIAKSAPSKAIILCNSLIEDIYVDDCLNTISKSVNNEAFCNSVRNLDSKDSCYMHFALAGDFSVCDKIVNRYNAVSCNYLSQAKEFEETAKHELNP